VVIGQAKSKLCIVGTDVVALNRDLVDAATITCAAIRYAQH
jgi:hypothetical protein